MQAPLMAETSMIQYSFGAMIGIVVVLLFFVLTYHKKSLALFIIAQKHVITAKQGYYCTLKLDMESLLYTLHLNPVVAKRTSKACSTILLTTI